MRIQEFLDETEDNGTMPGNVEQLAEHVVGHKIVSVEQPESVEDWQRRDHEFLLGGLQITLDNGKKVALFDTGDCCAFTKLYEFFLNPDLVDHVITGVSTSGGYTTWHIYADYGDILKLELGWSPGNPFYYGYGFDIRVKDIKETS